MNIFVSIKHAVLEYTFDICDLSKKIKKDIKSNCGFSYFEKYLCLSFFFCFKQFIGAPKCMVFPSILQEKKDTCQLSF